jgi:hypothetical protein
MLLSPYGGSFEFAQVGRASCSGSMFSESIVGTRRFVCRNLQNNEDDFVEL